jgi:hypothetical protein
MEETVALNGALSRIESYGHLMGQDRVEIFHLASAEGAQWRGKGLSPWFRSFAFKTHGQFYDDFHLFQRERGRGMEKPVIANLHEPGWEHMLEKPANKFHDIESHSAPPGTVGFLVPKGNLTIFNTNDAAV